ncbi:putative O-glycosylation ligase, exosortase A system-associated [Roseomonas nepalensis]|uniref:Putative O-glycosylation ligase, exosortase A system-associated n=1 Tax=Muricoccus nepalensis TaxID=1854500 RepID=A0A502GFI7_9PROT|nr:putative O-glycosylation ligase, exosortase A system-associated [Roseomonas nepalensis]TPG61077.1 putative O-glycosylation ligase, exosortase A system-associated [Roseomonas nepalensis]
MRDAVFLATMLLLLPLAVARPFVGILLWSWISFMNPHRLVYGPAGPMPWAMMVFAATLLGCLLAGEPKRLALNAVTGLIFTLMLLFTFTTIMALGDPTAVWAKWQFVEKVLLGLLLTASLLTERRRVHALIWVMVISIGYYGVRGGIFSLLTGGSYRIWGPDQTMIFDNNHLAAAMLVTLPLMNYLRLQSRNAPVRIGLAAAMCFTLLATITSYSRGALLGLAAATVILWWRSTRKVVTGAVLGVVLTGALAFMPAQWTERMQSIGSYDADASASERLVLWGISLKLALANPLSGSGFTGPYNRQVVDTVAPDGPARAVHSIWFELLGENGFPTFFVWVTMTLAGVYYTFRIVSMTRRRPELAWAYDFGRMAQVSIVAYLVSGTFLSLSYWDFYWTLLVVIAATHTLARQVVKAEERANAVGWRKRGVAAPSPAAGALEEAAAVAVTAAPGVPRPLAKRPAVAR